MARFFLRHQIETLAKTYKVTLISNFDGKDDSKSWLPKNVNIINIPIKRKISLISDFKVLFLLLKIFYQYKFSLVHSVSPKAGLLAMLASFLLQVPVRIHTFTGQVWVTRKGVIKKILKFLDFLIAFFATIALIDSHSQKDFLLKNGILKDFKSCVTGNGSICGVDLNKFKFDHSLGKRVRIDIGVSNNAFVFLFLGRANKDKGVIELCKAFDKLHKQYENTTLLFVGSDEDFLYSEIVKIDGVKVFPVTNHPEGYLNASDVLCLPSYREGFGHVIIEAAACRIPAIGSNIYGISDAIVDNETGILVAPGSVDELRDSMELLIKNNKLLQRLGNNACERANKSFSQELLTGEIMNLYENLLFMHSSDIS
tara:strand:+ start:1248 stop:2354 length:1107 start_codon:yes stop_codon:yes gene_type:complete